MNTPDAINGMYELFGGVAIWSNVIAIRKDKGYLGIRVPMMAFFTSWGLWNLYYYAQLSQWLSLCGGLNIAAANLAFVLSMIYYGKKKT